MPRKISSPEYGQLPKKVVPISIGGTNATTPEEAADNLGAVRLSKYGMPGGPAPLDANSQLRDQNVPLTSDVQSVDVAGLDSMFVSQSTSYVITDYDYSTVYTLSAISGTVSRNGETISYTAPAVAGTGGFTLNGKTYDIVIKAPEVNQPTIVTPVNMAVGIGETPEFTSSAFSVSGGTDSHATSDWQIATDSSFTNIVASITGSSTSKTSWTSTALQANTAYYARVRHNGAAFGASVWSPVSTFTTRDSFYPNLEQAMLLAESVTMSGQFGYSVGMSSDGNTVAIGAPFYSDIVGSQGACGNVHVFVRSGSTWSLQATIWPADRYANAYFGFSVDLSLDGNTLLIGAPRRYLNGASGEERGGAYIFVRSGSTWSQQGLLLPANSVVYDQQGEFVSLSGDGNTAAVGSWRFGSMKGEVTIFTRSGTTWTQQGYLSGSDIVAGDRFGNNIDLNTDGNTCIIGAYYKDISGYKTGKAYVFTRSGTTWSQQTVLSITATSDNWHFGKAVAISGDGNRVAVITEAEPHANASYGVTGYIRTYTRSGTVWALEQKFINNNPVGSQYPASISLSTDGTVICLGNYFEGDTGVPTIAHCGAAHIFKFSVNVWEYKVKAWASNRKAEDMLGFSSKISGDGKNIIAGAYGRDFSAGYNLNGASYVFV